MKVVGWDRKLWGVVSNIHENERHLIGETWDSSPEDSSKPSRPLLFKTRKMATEWCNTQNSFYRKYSNACRDWRFYPVRVRETITPIAKTAVEK